MEFINFYIFFLSHMLHPDQKQSPLDFFFLLHSLPSPLLNIPNSFSIKGKNGAPPKDIKQAQKNSNTKTKNIP